MKITIDFTVSVTEEYNGDPKELYAEEENRQILVASLKELTGPNADITIHDFKMTKED